MELLLVLKLELRIEVTGMKIELKVCLGGL